MYLVAQRVRVKSAAGEVVADDTKTGINTFLYLHKRELADGTLPDPSNGGEVEPLGGNDVLSYLDIVMDDARSIDTLEGPLLSFVTSTRTDPLPRTRELDGVRLTFHCSRSRMISAELPALWMAIKAIAAKYAQKGTP